MLILLWVGGEGTHPKRGIVAPSFPWPDDGVQGELSKSMTQQSVEI